MHTKKFIYLRSTRGSIFPRMQLVGVLRMHTYNMRENMHTNQLEGEAHTYIVPYIHSSLRTSLVHITCERIYQAFMSQQNYT